MDFKEVFVESSYPHTLRIPGDWVFTELSEAINVIGGSQPPKSEFSSEPKEGFVRLIQIRDYKSDQHKVFIPKDKARRFVKPDDVMIGRYGPPIFQILKGLEGAYNVALMKAEPVVGVMDNRYLYFYLQNRDIYNYVEAASDRTAGQSGVNKEHLEKYPVGLPPLAEQKVIADKLDTLLAQVGNIKARLERIPEIIKSFRQSVLAAAVSGKLTELWREGRNFCTITEELGILAKFIDYRGKTPTKTDFGVPLITAKNIRQGFISREPREFIAPEDYDSWMTRGIPKFGDVLITTEAPMGYVANIDIKEKFALAQRSICLQFRGNINPYFASIYMQASEFQKALDENATGSTVKGIKASLLKKIRLTFPDYNEQNEIVRRVEELFAFADRIEQAAQAAQSRVNNLTQSILAKAFRGELTADWRAANPDLISGDNSAEALLAKIKAERAKLSKKTKAKA